VVNWLNAGKLKDAGIFLGWAYDQRPYIRGAISLVQRNIFIGGTMAAIVLFIFLGSFSSTVVVVSAIPISIVGTFIFMSVLGRNLNVVSLAGIAFAVGMLIDSAIVVLENIDRHRKMGNAFGGHHYFEHPCGCFNRNIAPQNGIFATGQSKFDHKPADTAARFIF
jgi:HAE1 family hydrophobic/amphiphilic exporter-1